MGEDGVATVTGLPGADRPCLPPLRRASSTSGSYHSEEGAHPNPSYHSEEPSRQSSPRSDPYQVG